jgi:hypothetical protein
MFEFMAPLYDTPDDGGGGGDELDAHPDYDVNLDEAGGTAEAPHTASSPSPGAPIPRGSQGGQPPVPGSDQSTPQTVTPEQYDQVVQYGRYQQQALAQLQAHNALLQRQLAALTGVTPPQRDPSVPQLSEADEKAIAAVYRLFPKLRPLLERADELLQVPGTVKNFQTEADNRWTDLGTRMWTAFDQEVAKTWPGGRLHDFAQKAIDQAFISWLETDRNAAARYRMGDLTLPTEFMGMYRSGIIVPAQRGTNGNQPGPAARRTGAQPPRVPRGGPGATTVGSRPQQPNVKNADEVHDAAADAFFAQQ